tara:strand:+ start:190 stop:816 length:627 start_codon:yes stop_codon:yes gene_type:complete
MKKGAMFGLDARIALAIFGALSVISGAALYSAIKDARAIAFLNQLEEVSKAIDAYRLDVGRDVVTGNTGTTRQLGVLVKDYNTDAGWNGPYLPFEETSIDVITNDKKIFKARAYSDRNIAGVSTISNGVSCSSTKTCDLYITVEFNAVNKNVAEGIELYKALDAKIDGGDGFKSGKIHATQSSNNTTEPDPSGSFFDILYKTGPYLFR